MVPKQSVQFLGIFQLDDVELPGHGGKLLPF